jgi:4'-phosphopantetheinyl transferase
MTPFRSTDLAPTAAGTEALQDHAVCHVWSLPPVARPSAWFGLLDSTELSRCSSFAREADLARFVTGRLLARTALASLTGISPEEVQLRTHCPHCPGPHGKPRVVGAAEGWELSISHSGDVVVAALALGSPLGVDVELVEPWDGPDLPPEYELVLTDIERTEAQRARACLTYWTRKEAVLKATGEGLDTPMTDFTLSGPDQPPALLSWHQQDGTRPVPAIADLSLGEDYPAAVAALGVRSVLASVHDGADLLSVRRTAAGRPHTRTARTASTERPRPGRPSRARSPADRTR